MKKISVILFLLFNILLPHIAYSELNWHWTLQKPIQTVSPTDEIVFWATLFNNSSSAEVIYGPQDLSGYWLGGLGAGGSALDQYNIDLNYYDQFYGLVLTPGNSFNFLHARLTPKDGTVDIGTYTFSPSVMISYHNPDAPPGYRTNIRKYSDNQSSIVVQNEVPVVPEPISSILFVTGGMLLAGRRYIKRRKT